MTPVPILLYHSVATAASADYRPWCVHPEVFDAHLGVLDELEYTPLTVSGFVDARSTGTLPDKPCLITFDDGRADFVEGALPALVEHRVPATIYVVSGHVGGTSDWLPMPEERTQPMMGWDDLRALPALGVEVGAHSETHVELDIVSPRRLTSEVATSRHRLQEGLGTAIRTFAYPHGYHSARVRHAVRDAGFDSACAVKDRWSHVDEDRFALARMFVWDSTTADDLRRMLLDAPTATPGDVPVQRILRSGWRCARWVRHHTPGVRA